MRFVSHLIVVFEWKARRKERKKNPVHNVTDK